MPHIPAKDEKERERDTERKIKERERRLRNRQLNCKRGNTNIFSYVPGSVIDNKCVTLRYCHIFLQEMRER